MKIAGMVVWVLTAGIGVYVLVTGIGAQRRVPAAGPKIPEGSPLLEFTHPALALTGLTFWIFFVMTGDRPFAWVSSGVPVTAILAGVSWVFAGRRQRDPGRLRFPPHLLLLHGAAAACTLALVVIAAVAAG
jgi:hypothetical protein